MLPLSHSRQVKTLGLGSRAFFGSQESHSRKTVATPEAKAPCSSVLILFPWHGGSCVSRIPSAEGTCLVNCAILDVSTAHGPPHPPRLAIPHAAGFLLHALALSEPPVRDSAPAPWSHTKVWKEFHPMDRRDINIYQSLLSNECCGFSAFARDFLDWN